LEDDLLALWDDCTPTNSALFIIDCQEKLMAKMYKRDALTQTLTTLIQGFSLVEVPIFYSEQYPKGLGSTIEPIKSCLTGDPFEKTHFSCLQDPKIYAHVQAHAADMWVLAGIEAHVCLLQTAKDLVRYGKKVIVVRDATSSRTENNYTTALSELREIEVRLTCTETLLFELIQDVKHPKFKELQALVR
jgi:nicotinamidase-related amidase